MKCCTCNIVSARVVIETSTIIRIAKPVIAIVPPGVTVGYKWSSTDPRVIGEGIITGREERIVVPAPVVRWIIITERESVVGRRQLAARVVGICWCFIVSLLGRLLIPFCFLALPAGGAQLRIASCDAQCKDKSDHLYAVEAYYLFHVQTLLNLSGRR
jgi:hypothetical protein